MEIPHDWNEFIALIDPLQRQPLQGEMLKKIVKVPNLKEKTFEEIQQYFRNKFQITRRAERSKWHVDDKYFLIWCVSKLVQKKEISYKELSQSVSDSLEGDASTGRIHFEEMAQSSQIEFKELTLDIIRGRVANSFEKHNGKNQWTEITEEFIKVTKTMRYQKQIRERYNNVINPLINKDPFTQEEIFHILNYVEQEGKHWANISKHLPGRTDNKIKNIYNSVLRQIGKKLGKQYDNPDNELYILTQVKLYQTYDPTELFNQIEQAKSMEANVKTEPAQDSSSLSVQQMQKPYLNTFFYAVQQHPHPLYSYPQHMVFFQPVPNYHHPLNQNTRQKP